MVRRTARPLHERKELYAKVVRLRETGMSHSKIGVALGVNKATVSKWLSRKPPSRESYLPDLSYSSDLAYLIGFYLGDGRSAGEEKHVRFQLADVQQANLINRVMAAILRTAPRPVRVEGGFYQIQYTNAILYDFLQQPLLGFERWIVRFPAEFLSGFFDAEGYVSPYVHHFAELPISITIGVVNADSELLEQCAKLLHNLGLNGSVHRTNRAGQEMTIMGRTYKRRRDVYHLVLTGYNSAVLFAKVVGFRSPKKKQKLTDLISIFESHNDSLVRYDAFCNLYDKVGTKWIRKESHRIIATSERKA